MAANSAANSRVNSARNNALAAERTRQAQLDREAAAYNAKDQASYQDFAGQQAAKSQKLGDYFTQASTPSAAAPAGTATETMPDASGIVVAENAKQLGRAKAYTDQQGRALGELRSFGDTLGDLSREQARDAGYIGQIGGFKKGSSAVLPYELDAASHAGDGMKTLGDLAQGFGSIGLSAGLSKNTLPGMFGGSTPAVADGWVGGAAQAFGTPKAPSMTTMANPFQLFR
jgi:ribosomal protein S14